MATSWRQYLPCHISRRRRHFQQHIILTIASSIRRNFDLSSSKKDDKGGVSSATKHSWSSTPLNGWREAGGGVMLPLLTVRTVCFAIVTRIIATQTASRLDTVTSINAPAVCRCCWWQMPLLLMATPQRMMMPPQLLVAVVAFPFRHNGQIGIGSSEESWLSSMLQLLRLRIVNIVILIMVVTIFGGSGSALLRSFRGCRR
jgi:hypothetical protein